MYNFNLTVTPGEPVTEQAPILDTTADTTTEDTTADTTTADTTAEATTTEDTIAEDTANEGTTAEDTTTADTITSDITSATLPAGYLVGGYLGKTDKGKTYIRHVYVSDYAKQIANALSGTMKPSDFSKIIRELNKSKSRTLPFEARESATDEALSSVLALAHSNKAPRLLVDLFEANKAAIHNDEDWNAFIRHLTVIQNLIITAGD